MNVNLENLLMGIVEKIFETIVGLDVNSYPGIVVNYLLELVGELIGVDGLANMTVCMGGKGRSPVREQSTAFRSSHLLQLGDLLEELLDVTVSKSEECLHLAVSTPYDPSDGGYTCACRLCCRRHRHDRPSCRHRPGAGKPAGHVLGPRGRLLRRVRRDGQRPGQAGRGRHRRRRRRNQLQGGASG